jgi:hypothetical protein
MADFLRAAKGLTAEDMARLVRAGAKGEGKVSAGRRTDDAEKAAKTLGFMRL